MLSLGSVLRLEFFMILCQVLPVLEDLGGLHIVFLNT